jgi:hypothetical protein
MGKLRIRDGDNSSQVTPPASKGTRTGKCSPGSRAWELSASSVKRDF